MFVATAWTTRETQRGRGRKADAAMAKVVHTLSAQQLRAQRIEPDQIPNEARDQINLRERDQRDGRGTCVRVQMEPAALRAIWHEAAS